jgi:hypothetical protein
MKTYIRRSVMLLVAAPLALAAGIPAAQAANPNASCVGIIVSTEATAGTLDVDNFKAIAKSGGAPTFGRFVAVGAQLHEGSYADCFPQQ